MITHFDTNQIYDSVEYYGIGSGEKFVEVSLFYTNSATQVFRRIFERLDSNGDKYGKEITLSITGGTISRAYTAVRGDYPEKCVFRDSSNYTNAELDPFILHLDNFTQELDSNDQPVKGFTSTTDNTLSTVTGVYKFPDYYTGSRIEGPYSTSTIACVAWGGNWPKRRWDLSKNVLESPIEGYMIRSEKRTEIFS